LRKDEIGNMIAEKFISDMQLNCCSGGGWSREIWQRSVRSAVRLAISSRMTFDRNSNAPMGEDDYELAVVSGNRTACIAYERQVKRKPFNCSTRRPMHGGLPKRLYVGAWFIWRLDSLKVTSFSADGQSLTACSYRNRTPDDNKTCKTCKQQVWPDGKASISKRVSITLKEFRDFEKLLKEFRDFEKLLKSSVRMKRTSQEVASEQP